MRTMPISRIPCTRRSSLAGDRAPRGARRAPRVAPGRIRVLVTVAALLWAGACGSAADRGAARLSESDRREIAAAVERRLRDATDIAAGGDVVGRMLSLYPDTGRVVSSSGGYVVTDRDSLAASVEHFWEFIGQNMRSPEWRWGPMQVDVLGPDAAVITATYRIPHITPAGEPHVIGGAWTAVFARREGRWVVVQEHLSDAAGPLSPTP